ncbi:MAG: hypothetical protein AAGG08_00225 [Actinomycetota bacterium]
MSSPSSAPSVVLVTCRTWPDLIAGDALLADELRSRGCVVTDRPWNDAPIEDFTSADVVLFRSNWDYHHEMAEFGSWLDALEASTVDVQNSIDLVRFTLDKGRYLGALADAGVRTPATLDVRLVDGSEGGSRACRPTPSEIVDWVDQHGFERVVVKPGHGASGHGVALVERADLEGECGARAAMADARPFLVQEFVPQISAGELSLVFFAGEFSHAYRRTPDPSDFRVNGGHGGTTSAEPEPSADAIGFAAESLRALGVTPVYARVDVVGSTADDLVLMEFEIDEPALGLHLAPGSAERFADAILSAHAGRSALIR